MFTSISSLPGSKGQPATSIDLDEHRPLRRVDDAAEQLVERPRRALIFVECFGPRV
jgi:hypothetical protein